MQHNENVGSRVDELSEIADASSSLYVISALMYIVSSDQTNTPSSYEMCFVDQNKRIKYCIFLFHCVRGYVKAIKIHEFFYFFIR